ncbi:MAG: hypothetical protein QM756_19335 [Polyangiaceae bacterium]
MVTRSWAWVVGVGCGAWACGGAVDNDPAGAGGAFSAHGGAASTLGGSAQGGFVVAQGGATIAQGGSVSFGTGGFVSVGTGGTVSSGTGGTVSVGTGGTVSSGTGGFVSVGTGGEAGGGGEAGAPSCEGSYTACGCGCCGGVQQTTPTTCYYPEWGDSLATIVAADKRVAGSASCANAGCSFPYVYACCMSAPQEAQSAGQYTWSRLGDSLSLFKTDAQGMCGSLQLEIGAPPLPTLRADTFGWTSSGSYQPCSMSSINEPIGISGSIYAYRTSSGGTSTCALNVHVTLFIGLGNGGVRAARFDVDGIDAGFPADVCPIRF